MTTMALTWARYKTQEPGAYVSFLMWARMLKYLDHPLLVPQLQYQGAELEVE